MNKIWVIHMNLLYAESDCSSILSYVWALQGLSTSERSFSKGEKAEDGRVFCFLAICMHSVCSASERWLKVLKLLVPLTNRNVAEINALLRFLQVLPLYLKPVFTALMTRRELRTQGYTLMKMAELVIASLVFFISALIRFEILLL